MGFALVLKTAPGSRLMAFSILYGFLQSYKLNSATMLEFPAQEYGFASTRRQGWGCGSPPNDGGLRTSKRPGIQEGRKTLPTIQHYGAYELMKTDRGPWRHAVQERAL